MIKVEIAVGEKKKELPFPKLMKSHNGAIVLMSGADEHRGMGTFLSVGIGTLGEFRVGGYRENWDMNVFSDCPYSITISNEKAAE